MSQKSTLTYVHALSFTGNYHIFAHSNVSNRFNGRNDNVVLELMIFDDISGISFLISS